MEVDPEEILNYVKSQERFKGEIADYWASMKKLPNYDYSKFYATYTEYANNILQGDGIKELKFIQLPDEEVSSGVGIVISNSCDIEQENKRKFSTRIIYAPLMKLEAYSDMLKNAKKEDASGKPTTQKKYTQKEIDTHLEDIRKQRIGQIFYLPKCQSLNGEAIVFFDNLCSTDNDSVSRDNLTDSRMFSLSAYGWHVFLERLAHFFTKLSEETVELRLKPVATK